jgi:hypothetical protein
MHKSISGICRQNPAIFDTTQLKVPKPTIVDISDLKGRRFLPSFGTKASCRQKPDLLLYVQHLLHLSNWFSASLIFFIMLFNAIKIVVLALLTYPTVAEVCIPILGTTCPTEQCSETSTDLCQCPNVLETYCDFSHETCSGSLGSCIQITTTTITYFFPPFTSTTYVATVSTYSTIITEVDYVTVDVPETDTFTNTVTVVG